MPGLDDVQRVIVVLSGKGGVGKSTVSVQLSLCLKNLGYRVGLLDVDLCGPSIPRMFGLETTSKNIVYESEQGWTPIYIDESKTFCIMSIGFLLENLNDAIIWRGPRKMAMIQRLITGVNWSNLDYLIIDTPPGTSDEHITVMNILKQANSEKTKDYLRSVLVTTPQMLSVNDVRREITFCNKTGFHILGIIENMSGYICPHCTECTNLFAKGGGQLLAQEYSLPFLGMIPIDNQLNSILDSGIYSNKENNQEKQFFETEAVKLISIMVKQIIEQW